MLSTKKSCLSIIFTEKYMKSCDSLQVIIYKVKTALKEKIPRNIIQACLSQFKKSQSGFLNDTFFEIHCLVL
jgi:hypothetical protein